MPPTMQKLLAFLKNPQHGGGCGSIGLRPARLRGGTVGRVLVRTRGVASVSGSWP